MAESKEELKSLLMRVKEVEYKNWLKLNIKKTKNGDHGIRPYYFMASRKEKVEVVGSKITVNGDCSHEIRRLLLCGRKAMTSLDMVLKNGNITFLTKVHIVKVLVFPVLTYGCESWTVQKAEHQRIDALKLWCWRRLQRVPWTARRSNWSVLRESNPEYIRIVNEAETPVFGRLMQTDN